MASRTGKKVPSLLPPAFAALSVLDYLDQDQRPTFVIDLASDALDPGSDLDPVFVNEAFQHWEASGKLPLDWNSSIHRAADARFHTFISWATREICDDSIEYLGCSWTAITVRRTWRFVSTAPGAARYRAATSEAPKITPVSNGHVVHDEILKSPLSTEFPPAHEILDVLASLGSASLEHCRLISNYDWASTPIGPIATWPPLLLQTIPYLMCNTEPSTIIWGKERTLIYNESYPILIKDLHPAALGSSGRTVFAAAWQPFENLLHQIEETRRAVKQHAVRVVFSRSGSPEEAYFNYSFVPLLHTDGSVGGIQTFVHEVTKQVVTERQMGLLIKIAESTSSSATLSELWRCFFDAIQDCSTDLPFLAVYSKDSNVLVSDPASVRSSNASDHGIWHLEGSVGFSKDHPAVAQTLDISGEEGLAPILRLASTHSSPLSVNSEHTLLSEDLRNGCIDRGFGSSFRQMVICPMSLSTEGTAAYIVIGVNPLRPFNDDYAQFANLLTRQMEDTATSVMLSMREKKHLERTVEQAEYQRRWLSEQLMQQTKEARQSELRFYNFANQAPVGVYILGSEGEIKYCNDAWYGLVGIPIGFQGPVPWRIHVHPEDLEAVDQQWELLKKGQSQSNFEWRAVRNIASGDFDDSKDIVYLRSSAFPQLREDGSFETVTGILMDVSVHKAHEREVANRLTNALEAKRSQENFMDMVSHEMRNPLNAMLQCAGEAYQLLQPLIAGSCLASEAATAATDALEAIDTIQYCGRHQKQIIDDVLTISKLDSNLLTLCPIAVAPVNVISQAVKIFTSEIRAAEIEITQNVDPDGSHSPCLMDSNRILQILINLIGNAIKFLRERPVRKLMLSVKTSTVKPSSTEVKFVRSGRQRKPPAEKIDWGPGHPIYIYFSVTDTGPGLTPKEMETLFARFRQASPRTHAQYGGSGLGLFISRELVELHRGEIGLASQVGKGSTFAFYVEGRSVVKNSETVNTSAQHNGTATTSRSKSISSGMETFALASPSPTSRTPPESITILIVEDNIVNQKVLQRQLKRLGYKVATANHGLEALELVQRSCWSLDGGPNGNSLAMSIILCDLEMPVMDGLTCVREIRKRQRNGLLKSYIPMVAVTGNARAEQVHAAKEAGFDDVVCKPYNVPDLVPLMHELVDADGAPLKRVRIATD